MKIVRITKTILALNYEINKKFINGEVEYMNKDVIKINDIVDILIKRWKMILLITLIATILSAIISFLIIPPKYEASTKLFIGKELNAQGKEQSYDTNDVQMYQKLLKTYAEIIKTNDLIKRAINSSNLNESSESILNTLNVTPRNDTQILEISYISKNKTEASDVVNAVTNEFIKSSRNLIPNGNVKIIESVTVPDTPVSPNKKLNITIAFLAGLIISVGLSFLLEFMDNTFKTREEMEEILELPVLGTIPDYFKS
jgi:capsular polysaccharide biosynthesis protein